MTLRGTNEVSLRLAGGYYFHALKRLLADLEPVFGIGEPTSVLLDLSDLTFLGPAALGVLAAVLANIREGGFLEQGRVITPRSAGLNTYLERIGFNKIIMEPGSMPTVVAHETRGFRECIRFAGEAECRAVAKTLSESLAESGVVTDPIAQASLDACLTELAENVYFHADAEHGGFATVQHLRNSHEVEIAIVDLGVGIRGSLSKNPALDVPTDDLEAIKTAMTVTVTATPERNSGYGLAFTNFLLGLNDGRMMVRSGCGHVQRGAKVINALETHDLPGTLVAMRLRTDRPFDSQRAWTLLEQAIEQLTGRHPDADDDRDNDD